VHEAKVKKTTRIQLKLRRRGKQIKKKKKKDILSPRYYLTERWKKYLTNYHGEKMGLAKMAKHAVNQRPIPDFPIPPYLPIIDPNRKTKPTQSCRYIRRAAYEPHSPGFFAVGDYSHVHRNGENRSRMVACSKVFPLVPAQF